MTFRRPPAAASWCLLHLSDPDEGLLGDMIEEYQRRQSPIWYWRQVATAIVVGFIRSVWMHKLETVQAVFTGLSALGVAARVAIEPVMWMSGTLLGRGWSLPPGLERRLHVDGFRALVPGRGRDGSADRSPARDPRTVALSGGAPPASACRAGRA